MIDPAVLERQKRTTIAAPRPKRVDAVRLVARPGPKLSDTACALGCGRLLAWTNTRGVCAQCANTKWKATGRKDNRKRSSGPRRSLVAVRRWWFSHGGGI